MENLESWDENIHFLLVFVGIESYLHIPFVFHCVGWAQYNAMEDRGRDKGRPQEVTYVVLKWGECPICGHLSHAHPITQILGEGWCHIYDVIHAWPSLS